METKYRPEIDGLRTLAVGGVILFHLDPHMLPGGYLGVDVFFVISGFLISSLILRDLRGDGFSFRKFWTRRAKRILPAMLAMTAVTLAVVWFFAFKGDIPRTGGHAVAALLSIANIYSWRKTGDYWGSESESAPLLHTWSLSVEEQFYLFVPLMLFLLFRYARVALPYVVGTLMILSFAVFLYGVQRNPEAAFYLLPTRAWELGAGVLLACTRPMAVGHERLKQAASVLGVALIGLAYAVLSEMQSGAPVAVLGTVLIIWGGQHGVVFRLLALSPMVYMGKLSYSLYLWHWPVIVLGRELPAEPIPVWAMLTLTAVLSLACYYAVERPLRFAKSSLPYILGATAAAILLSGMVYRSSGVYDTSDLPQVTYRAYEYDLRPNAPGHAPTTGAFAAMDLPKRTVPEDTYRTGGVVVGNPEAVPDVVLTGNSHGVMWSHAVRTACEDLGLNARLWSMDGIDPAFSVPPKRDYVGQYVPQEVKFEYDQARHDMIAKWKPKVVLIGARWDSYSNTDQLRQTLGYLAAHAEHVVLIGQPPALDFGQRFAVQVLAWRGISNAGNPDVYLDAMPKSWKRGHDRIHALADTFDNVSVLETHDLFEGPTNDQALVLSGGEILYYDDDHLSESGAQRVTPRFRDALAEFLAITPAEE